MELPVLHRGDPDIDTGHRARQAVGGNPGVFQGLPGDFHQDALLRVHALGFARRNAEELGVKLIDLLEKSPEAGDHLSGRSRVRIVQTVQVPPFGGCFGDGVHAVLQEAPEFHRVVGAGKPTADPDNGDGFPSSLVSFAEGFSILRI